MPQHRDLRHPLDAHPCPTRTRRENLGDFRRTRHSRTVFLPDDRTLGEQIEAMQKHQDASSPINTPARAAVHPQATPPTRWQCPSTCLVPRHV